MYESGVAGGAHKKAWNGVTCAFSGNGPNRVGSFGPKALPKFVLAVNGPQACSFNASGRDWRFMDMEWDGSALPPHGTDGASASGAGGTDLLFSRLYIHHAGSVGWGAGGTHVCIHESSVEDNGYFSIYTAACQGTGCRGRSCTGQRPGWPAARLPTHRPFRCVSVQERRACTPSTAGS